MCYTYEISRDTFVIGSILTAINAYIFRNSSFFTVANICWFAPILMQLWEAMIWKNYHCEQVTKLALITNITQPFLLLLLLGLSGKFVAKDPNYLVIAITCIVYSLTIVPYLGKDYGCIRNEHGIGLVWWSTLEATIYCITMTILVFQLATPQLAKFFAGYFYFTWLAAHMLRIREAELRKIALDDLTPVRTGSIWCWAASFAPVYNLLVFKYLGL